MSKVRGVGRDAGGDEETFSPNGEGGHAYNILLQVRVNKLSPSTFPVHQMNKITIFHNPENSHLRRILRQAGGLGFVRNEDMVKPPATVDRSGCQVVAYPRIAVIIWVILVIVPFNGCIWNSLVIPHDIDWNYRHGSRLGQFRSFERSTCSPNVKVSVFHLQNFLVRIIIILCNPCEAWISLPGHVIHVGDTRLFVRIFPNVGLVFVLNLEHSNFPLHQYHFKSQFSIL